MYMLCSSCDVLKQDFAFSDRQLKKKDDERVCTSCFTERRRRYNMSYTILTKEYFFINKTLCGKCKHGLCVNCMNLCSDVFDMNKMLKIDDIC